MSEDQNDSPLTPQTYVPSKSRRDARFWARLTAQLAGVVALAMVAFVLWFIVTSHAVRIQADPEEATTEISGGIVLKLGNSFMLRSGSFQIQTSAPGYYTREQQISIGDADEQIIEVQLDPLPGRVEFVTTPAEGTRVMYDGRELGVTPLVAKVPAGSAQFSFTADRYLPTVAEEVIEGRDQLQVVTVELNPDWADVTLPTHPEGVSVFIDDALTEFKTPGPIEVPSGEHVIRLELDHYEPWSDIVLVSPGQQVTMQTVVMKLSGALAQVTTNPPSAGVTLDGEYMGITPITLYLDADRRYQLRIYKRGYKRVTRQVQLKSGMQSALGLQLQEETGTLHVKTLPEGAEVWVNGEPQGTSNTSLTLQAVIHEIELVKDGYAGYVGKVDIQPDLEQDLNVELLTDEQARLEALRNLKTTTQGHELVLLEPSTIQMGASRRQPGRRANEVFRSANLTRLFYLSKFEVTNEQFRAFASGHTSGEFEGYTLDKPEQPVVNVSWNDAALYCNFVSDHEGYPPFYEVEYGRVIGVDDTSLGFRLPTEAEWSWAARHTSDSAPLLLFAWGDSLPPPERYGNYADRSAQHNVGRVIFGYNDNHIVASPVGTFEANFNGIFDIGGNVSEWVHDFYSIPNSESVVSNLGPSEGEFHVIRGANWMSGTVTDLRLSFRDYSTDGRPNVGFRIARFAE